MSANLSELLASAPVIPLIQADDPATAVAIARALAAGGMPLVEVVQRTDTSLECLAAIAEALPEIVTGAGTVLTADQCTACIVNGARFVVSPGLDREVVECAVADGVAALPGIMTPSELQQAHNLGLEVVKFFPAATAGGVAALKALASVFRRMRFVPTGGISAANLANYLALPSVIACGGSWLTPAAAIAAGDFDRITQLASEALAIAHKAQAAAR